jgi:hypothetical protein
MEWRMGGSLADIDAEERPSRGRLLRCNTLVPMLCSRRNYLAEQRTTGMKSFSKYMIAAAAVALASAPAMANPAASLSVAKSSRAATVVEGESTLAGGGFIAVIAAIAVIISIVVIATEDDPDSP